ncbi:hypothetical protein D3C85_1769890 [compost metagenome]
MQRHMKISHCAAVCALAAYLFSGPGIAQSISIGGGTRGSPEGPRAVEEQSIGVSYSSSAAACARAKSSASDTARRKPNFKDISLGC